MFRNVKWNKFWERQHTVSWIKITLWIRFDLNKYALYVWYVNKRACQNWRSKHLVLKIFVVLLIYPAIQTPAEFLLHKLQGLELLLTRCRRTPCFTGICPQQLTTLFMHDGNDYGCGRYWYWYRYWYPILTSLMSGHRTGSDTIDEPSKKRVRLAGTATATCSTASAVNPASSTRSQPEEVEPSAIEHSVTETAEVELIEFSSTGET